MKRIEARVAKDREHDVEAVLVSSGLIYSRQEVSSESGKAVLFVAAVPDDAVGHTVDNITKQLDMRMKENAIFVSPLEAAISPAVDALQERARAQGPAPAPLESILQPLERYVRLSPDIVTMLVVATVVALSGLFLNNVAVVIGAMLLSPMIGPLNAVAVNAVLGNVKDLVRAEASLFALVFVSIAVAGGITAVASLGLPLTLTSQILLRTHVTILDVTIAIFIGVAGGLAVMTKLPDILVGVAVAVAFIPPTTVAGIGIALGKASIFEGAFFLALANLFGLTVGEMLTLKAKGLSPRTYHEIKKAKVFGLYSLLVFFLILALLALLVLTVVH